MKGDGWLLKAIFAEALKAEDIAFLRELLATEKSNKKIRLQMVERMIANSEGMKSYIREEKVTALMSILANQLHWYLIFAVTQRSMDEKKSIAGWNDKHKMLVEKKSKELKEKMFTELGKWRFCGQDEEGIEEAMSMLQQTAEEVLEEIENGKKYRNIK